MATSEDNLRPAGLQDPHPQAPGDGINAGRNAEMSAATAGEMACLEDTACWQAGGTRIHAIFGGIGAFAVKFRLGCHRGR